MVAVGGEGEALAVGREHREAVEAGGVGDPLEARAVRVHRPELELAPGGIAVVGGEDHSLAAGEEGRGEGGGVEVGELARLAAVGVGGPDLELARPHQPARQELPVVVELGPHRPRGAPDDLPAVGREVGAAVVARGVGQPLDVAAIGIHPVELEIAVTVGGEDQRAVLGADGRLGVVGGVLGQPPEVAAVRLRGPDLIGRVDGPDVALRAVGRRRAGVARGVGGGEEHAAAVRGEVGAGGPSFAGRDQRRSAAAIRREAEDLVAGIGRAGRLEDQLPAVGRPVRLGVLAAMGELDDVRQVRLAGMGGDRGRCRDAVSREQRDEESGGERRRGAEDRSHRWESSGNPWGRRDGHLALGRA